MLTPEQAVDAVNERYGRHAGYRALHAKGTVCTGTFTATPEAARLTRAVHMQGQPVDATIRFSNGSGDPLSPDHAPDVRGMATKLRPAGAAATDIVAQTVPVFPVRTPEGFVEFLRANGPGLGRVWRLPAFLVTHREALPGLPAAARALKPPASYASCNYYAIHAFKWIGADGTARWVRYTWLPEASEPTLSTRDAVARGRDYLQEDLRSRLGRQPCRFRLQLQLAGAGDRTDDATAVWPASRETVIAGTLDVTGLGEDHEADGGVLVFDPVHVTDGIELSDDPILRFRPRAYSVSIERRTTSAPSDAG
jgi:catalase